jgi:hypothetical protein
MTVSYILLASVYSYVFGGEKLVYIQEDSFHGTTNRSLTNSGIILNRKRGPFLLYCLGVFFFTCLVPTLFPLSGVGTTCFHHVVIKIRQLFYDQPPV